MAARPDPRPADGLLARVSLLGGLAASGVWKDLDTQTWTFEALWGQTLEIPGRRGPGGAVPGGAMTYLSDLDPSRVEETPFFGHRMPWRRDVGLLGEPLRMDGQTYDHGVAVHSRSRLTYDLNGRYARFEALLGFDDAASGQGAGRLPRPRRRQGTLRPDRPPRRRAAGPSVAPVAGAQQLRLEVDFGRDQDTGDRVIWANARLYRPTPQAAVQGHSNEPDSDGVSSMARVFVRLTCLWSRAGSAASSPRRRPTTRSSCRSRSTSGRSGSASPSQTMINAARVYRERDARRRSARAGPKLEDKEQAGKFPVAPISVVAVLRPGVPRRRC